MRSPLLAIRENAILGISTWASLSDPEVVCQNDPLLFAIKVRTIHDQLWTRIEGFFFCGWKGGD